MKGNGLNVLSPEGDDRFPRLQWDDGLRWAVSLGVAKEVQDLLDFKERDGWPENLPANPKRIELRDTKPGEFYRLDGEWMKCVLGGHSLLREEKFFLKRNHHLYQAGTDHIYIEGPPPPLVRNLECGQWGRVECRFLDLVERESAPGYIVYCFVDTNSKCFHAWPIGTDGVAWTRGSKAPSERFLDSPCTLIEPPNVLNDVASHNYKGETTMTETRVFWLSRDIYVSNPGTDSDYVLLWKCCPKINEHGRFLDTHPSPDCATESIPVDILRCIEGWCPLPGTCWKMEEMDTSYKDLSNPPSRVLKKETTRTLVYKYSKFPLGCPLHSNRSNPLCPYLQRKEKQQ